MYATENEQRDPERQQLFTTKKQAIAHITVFFRQLSQMISAKNYIAKLTAGILRTQRCRLSTNAQRRAAFSRKQAEKLSFAPASIASIPAEIGDDIGEAGAAIRPIGCSRRVFLINPHLKEEEIEGLAYRLRALSTNESLNSVLIATDDEDPRQTEGLPSMVLDQDSLLNESVAENHLFDPKSGSVWHAAGGYDPLAWFKSGKHKDAAAVASLLDSIEDLALATKGRPMVSRIPIITIPHGAVTDSGYALCLSTYMIATEQTHFRISNPSRGLTFDPVGFSAILPRLGWEFNQPCAPYTGCGYILALMGYEATPEDMIETGLASHYMSNPTVSMGMLERTLSQLRPWNQQEFVKSPPQTEGDRMRNKYRPIEETPDHHRFSRNVAVASTIDAFTSYAAHDSGSRMVDVEEDQSHLAAFDLDPTPWSLERESDLVDYAYSFDDIFKREETVEGLLESFRQIAERKTKDSEEQEGIDVASDFVKRLEEQAPLALRVTHKLMKLGAHEDETFQSCMRREKAAQAKLMTMPDFENWGKAQLSISGSKAKKFTGWQHRGVADVSEDEVSEIIGV